MKEQVIDLVCRHTQRILDAIEERKDPDLARAREIGERMAELDEEIGFEFGENGELITPVTQEEMTAIMSGPVFREKMRLQVELLSLCDLEWLEENGLK